MTSFLALISAFVIGLVDPVTALSVLPNLDRTEILVEVQGTVEHRAFQMEGPDRIILDLMNAQHELPQDSYPDINRGGVRSITAQQYSEDIVRIEIQLDKKVGYTVEKYDGYVRVSLENPNGSELFDPWESLAINAEPSVLEQMAALVPEAEDEIVPAPQEAERMTVTFDVTPIEDVLFFFADFSDRSIVPGQNVSGRLVTAEIKNEPWDDALDVLLRAQGLIGTELEGGIIRVDDIQNLNTLEAAEPLVTVPYRISFSTATEMVAAITPLLSQGPGGGARGQAVAAQNTKRPSSRASWMSVAQRSPSSSRSSSASSAS